MRQMRAKSISKAAASIICPPAAATLRNEHFGMIFQFYHLLPELSTLENVLAPIMIRYGVLNYWRHKREHVERAKTCSIWSASAIG